MDKITESQGRWAVLYARRCVESTVKEDRTPAVPEDVDPEFEEERGVFVTLEKGGELRGCIGRPRSEQPAARALREAAAGAAENDPRFPPVRPGELDEITVEVSILTPPSPLEDIDPADYPDAIRIGRDGLIVSRDGRSGLLLPKVPVEQGWSTTEFLAGTCRKAGLTPRAWQDEETTVERFQAQAFGETEPDGRIEPEGMVEAD
ncbi:MAG: TIGR00296 family protein [Halodesulfurarchaeum sp.]